MLCQENVVLTGKMMQWVRLKETSKDLNLGKKGISGSQIRLEALKQIRKDVSRHTALKQIRKDVSREPLSEVTRLQLVAIGTNLYPSGQTDTYPVLVSGRITSIIVHPEDPEFYGHATQGGVWKTKDGGKTGKQKRMDSPSFTIGALAMDPKDPAVLYAGTGEGNLIGANSQSYYGCGILKSIDGGETWIPLAQKDENGPNYHL